MSVCLLVVQMAVRWVNLRHVEVVVILKVNWRIGKSAS